MGGRVWVRGYSYVASSYPITAHPQVYRDIRLSMQPCVDVVFCLLVHVLAPLEVLMKRPVLSDHWEPRWCSLESQYWVLSGGISGGGGCASYHGNSLKHCALYNLHNGILYMSSVQDDILCTLAAQYTLHCKLWLKVLYCCTNWSKFTTSK